MYCRLKIVLIIFLNSVSILINAQRALPAPYSTTAINYVRAWDVVIPIKDVADLNIQETNINKAIIKTEYVDGLGRPIQTVIKNGSLITGGSPVDLVTSIDYNDYGREEFSYLPFAANNYGGNTSIADGKFKSNPFQQQGSFMLSQFPFEQYFYGQSQLEPSPLARQVKTFFPGDSWMGANRGVSAKYWTNTSTDAVRLWIVENGSNVGDFGSFSSVTTTNYPATYPAGTLYKNITEDEHGKQVIEFKDKEGRIILKKVQLSASRDDGTGSAHAGWLCTYYIYDVFGQLRGVIQPSGVEILLANSWTLTTVLYDEQVFRYEYDENNRMISKKVPGKAAVQIVYDSRDRVVMTQDGNLAASGKWLVTSYDEINRPVQTGLVSNSDIQSRTVSQHRAYASSSTEYPFTVTNIPSSYELLTKTGYDSYSNLPSGAPISTLDVSVISGNFLTTYNATPEYAQQVSQSIQTIGLPTWSQTKVLGTSIYLYSVRIYDEKGRVIQMKSTNISGGIDIATTQFDFSGKVLRTHLKHQKSGTNADVYNILTKNEYDLLGRLASIKKKINNGSTAITTDKTILTNQYDAIGHLKTKSIGEDPLSTSNPKAPLEVLNYKYNIRGWIQSMNGDYVDGSGNSRFGYKLSYDEDNYSIPAANYVAQYNGNISSSIWRSTGDGEIRRYNYGYDAVNRLTKGEFTQLTGGTFNINAGIDYTIGGSSTNSDKITYDANGNILEMWQKGWKLGGSDWIDKLSYKYFDVSNRLQNVIDASQDKFTKLGDFRYSSAYETQLGGTGKIATSTIDYDYDVNGNLIKDLNKDINDNSGDGIIYNHLNLPTLIKVNGKGSIEYIYDAAGTKLKKIVHETGQLDKVTSYMAGVYENDVLQFFGHEEGRARFTNNGNQPVVYDYMIKDHLGNIRMVLTEEQKVDKYPVASLETSKLTTEQAFYTISTNQISLASSVTGLPTYTNDNGIGNNPSDATFEAANSAKLYFLNSNNAKTGLGITLKVMAGDKLDIFGKSYYFQNNTGGSNANTSVGVLEILSGMLGTPSGVVTAAGHGGISATQLSGLTGTTAGINSLFYNQGQNYTNDQKPKAYINYIFFDERFNVVPNGFNFSPVGSNSSIKDHYQDLQNIAVPKNGYVYIYCSNESPVNVYFDNLQVVHTKGRITEETHYYPFGLTMQGISSKILVNGFPENKYLYNSIENNSEFDLNLYDAYFRNLDPQIGRFSQIDPKTESSQGWSPYTSMYNNPITNSDPLGDSAAWFRSDGSFWKFVDDGKKEWSGVYYQKSTVTSTFTKDGNTFEVKTYSDGLTFEFNDPGVDILALKNGVESGGKVGITGIEVLSDAKVNAQIDRSGVKSKEAQNSPIAYAKHQATGRMDYGVQGIISGDLDPKKFYIRDGTAYNVGDIGNYLWGRGMAELKISLTFAQMGAHWNNMTKGQDQKTAYYDFGPGTYNGAGVFDSHGDQMAICNGYLHNPAFIEAARKASQNMLKYYKPYNFHH